MPSGKVLLGRTIVVANPPVGGRIEEGSPQQCLPFRFVPVPKLRIWPESSVPFAWSGSSACSGDRMERVRVRARARARRSTPSRALASERTSLPGPIGLIP